MLITLSVSKLLVFLAPLHPFHIVLHCAPAGLSLSTYISGRYPVRPNLCLLLIKDEIHNDHAAH